MSRSCMVRSITILENGIIIMVYMRWRRGRVSLFDSIILHSIIKLILLPKLFMSDI